MIELNRVRGDIEADDFVSVYSEEEGEGERIGARAAVDDVMASAAVDRLAVVAEMDRVRARAAGDCSVDSAANGGLAGCRSSTRGRSASTKAQEEIGTNAVPQENRTRALARRRSGGDGPNRDCGGAALNCGLG